MDFPERIGKYRIIKFLAAGGMGEVFLARQEGPAGFRKPVVVKRLLPQHAASEGFLEMFLNEARLAAMLTHANIVQVFDLGEDQGTYYLAMEYVRGQSLRQLARRLRLKGERLPMGLAAWICAQALHGLHHAHEQVGERGEPLHIVHRDVSPDNLLVGYDGSVKVLDFGIAKAKSSISTTSPGTVKGKFAYMSPEHLRGEDVDGRADVYAMGVVLYELLAGQRPFKGSTDSALILAVLQENPPPLHAFIPSVNEELERIANTALAKSPGDRYQTAAAMAADLERFAAAQAPPMGVETLRAILQREFGDEVKGSISDLVAVTEAPAEGASRESAPRPSAPRKISPSQQTVSSPHAPVGPRGPSRLVLGVVGLALALGAGLGVWLVRGSTATVAPPRSRPAIADAGLAGATVTAPDAKAAPDGGPAPLALAPVADAGVTLATPPLTDGGAPAATARSGFVDLNVVPWGEVSVNGRSLGVTPLEPIPLPAGAHVLIIKNPDMNVTRKVKVIVPAGGTRRVKVDLNAEGGGP